MEINNSIFELISEMEYIIGNETTTKFMGAGVMLDKPEYPCRYPVRISLDKDSNESKIQVRNEGKVHQYKEMHRIRDKDTNEWKVIREEKATPDVIETMYYAFGTCRLYIGDGLKKVLEFLENRYNLDFNKLEKELKTK